MTDAGRPGMSALTLTRQRGTMSAVKLDYEPRKRSRSTQRLDHDLRVAALVITALAVVELLLSPIDRVFAPGYGVEAAFFAGLLWLGAYIRRE